MESREQLMVRHLTHLESALVAEGFEVRWDSPGTSKVALLVPLPAGQPADDTSGPARPAETPIAASKIVVITCDTDPADCHVWSFWSGGDRPAVPVWQPQAAVHAVRALLRPGTTPGRTPGRQATVPSTEPDAALLQPTSHSDLGVSDGGDSQK